MGHLVADRVVVVADRCTDGTQAMIHDEFAYVCLVDSERVLRAAGGRSEGLRHTRQDYVFFVDDDNIVDASCLSELVRLMEVYPRIGLLGPLMLNYPKESGVWCAGGEVHAMRVRHRLEAECVPDQECPGTFKPCDYLPNAFLARREIVTAIAPFDPTTFPSSWSEQDHGMRVKRAGYEIRVAPAAQVWHDSGYHSLTTRLGLWQIEDNARARLFFRRRWARGWGPWLQFWGVVFPVSSAYYLARCVRGGHFAAWSAAYLRGTLRGARGPLPPPPRVA
jgi:GT2 family glycosyltransferase